MPIACRPSPFVGTFHAVVKPSQSFDKERIVDKRLQTPTDLDKKDVTAVSEALNGVLADAFALYLKYKNFHWHLSGRRFRDLHLLFDEHAAQILGDTDVIAERVRRIGGITLRSIGQITQFQTLTDNNETFVAPQDMVTELMADNQACVKAMRATRKIAEEAEDVATTSELETMIDRAENRAWFLFEIGQDFADEREAVK